MQDLAWFIPTSAYISGLWFWLGHAVAHDLRTLDTRKLMIGVLGWPVVLPLRLYQRRKHEKTLHGYLTK